MEQLPKNVREAIELEGVREKEMLAAQAIQEEHPLKVESAEEIEPIEPKAEEPVKEDIIPVESKKESIQKDAAVLIEEERQLRIKAEQRHKVADGMLKATGEQIKTLNQRLKELEDSKQSEIRDKKVTALKAKRTELAEKFGEDGEDVISDLTNLLKEELKDEVIKPIESKIDQFVTDAADTKLAKFWEKVYSEIPDVKTINVSPEFSNYLDTQYEGRLKPVSFRVKINAAQESLDADEVVAIFKAFKEDTGLSMQERADKLNSMVTPPKGQSSPPPKNDGESFSRKQVDKFYDDVAKGKYIGKEDIARSIEKRIFAAEDEGRIY